MHGAKGNTINRCSILLVKLFKRRSSKQSLVQSMVEHRFLPPFPSSLHTKVFSFSSFIGRSYTRHFLSHFLLSPSLHFVLQFVHIVPFHLLLPFSFPYGPNLPELPHQMFLSSIHSLFSHHNKDEDDASDQVAWEIPGRTRSTLGKQQCSPILRKVSRSQSSCHAANTGGHDLNPMFQLSLIHI